MSFRRGFTLIELSIVLVIIGLIVGGVLVGRDLISAAAMRAQISQIEKIQTATYTFREKYGALPGDISVNAVAQYGFTTPSSRGGGPGRGDGNGLIEGYDYGILAPKDGLSSGEAAWFWEDLTANSGLLEGKFTTAADTFYSVNTPLAYLPAAKINGSDYVYIYTYSNVNYFGLSYVQLLDGNGAINNYAPSNHVNPGLTVQQAYTIDKKIDDGFPLLGNVVARYQEWFINFYIVYAAGGGVQGATSGATGIPASVTTCYDNNNVAGAALQYSLKQNGGNGTNCALSFRFK